MQAFAIESHSPKKALKLIVAEYLSLRIRSIHNCGACATLNLAIVMLQFQLFVVVMFEAGSDDFNCIISLPGHHLSGVQ